MLDESNPASAMDEIVSRLEKVGELAKGAFERLGAAAKDSVVRAKGSSPKEVIPFLKDFVSKAQAFLKSPGSTKFPHELEASHAASGTESSEDIDDSADPEFLVEFIEKHSTMMEEFEASLIEFRMALDTLDAAGIEEARGELKAFVKGYIHNVKGDAGSIGLLGIERVCHFVEDILTEKTPDTMIDELLAFKGWTIDCLRALSAKKPIPESAAKFKERFSSLCNNETRSVTPPSALSPTNPTGEELPSVANLDLLAELMAEMGDTVSTAPKVTEPVKEEKVEKKVANKEETHSEPAVGEEYSLTGEPEIFQEFSVEAEDHLNTVESTILECGGNYTSDAIAAIFRSIHSIKGSSSYFGLKEITETSHVTENLLDEVREGNRPFDQGLTELVLKYLDLQRTLLNSAKTSLKEGGKLVRIEQSGKYMKQLRAYEGGDKNPSNTNRATETKAAAPAPVTSAAPAVGEGGEKAAAASGDKLDVKTFVKVDTRRLDQLIDAIGEMGIYCSMLIQKCRTHLAADEHAMKTSHQVEKVTRDVQNIGMSMRLIPIRGLFQKMSRLVWDLGKKVGKDIKFSMEGEDTELDRTIIDRLADPLMHMIRNAIDHGVESPDERVAKGKARTGNVKLSAYHSGGSIHIRIEDDGRGLDHEKLIKKAVEKGILQPEEKITPSQAYQLIFAAGFSTAAVVTDVSGRGVGMDVVKRNIEGMRGRVNIESVIGKGTIFTIELPLTLAIMDGIEVAVGSEHFIIPMLSVIEFIRPGSQSLTRTFDRGETFFFRGEYLPVYRLAELFNLEAKHHEPSESNFVILESHGERYALMVDDIVGSYSTVIKNLGTLFEQGKGIAGCAIMAHGDVALILDVRSLLTTAREFYSHSKRDTAAEAPRVENSQDEVVVH